jgi:hypothetical protein
MEVNRTLSSRQSTEKGDAVQWWQRPGGCEGGGVSRHSQRTL